MKKNLLFILAMLSTSYSYSPVAAAVAALHEGAAVVGDSAETAFFKAKEIATAAYESNDYTTLLALMHAGIPGLYNINDFGGAFLEFGSGYDSFQRLLNRVKSKVSEFTEPTLEEITKASRHIRKSIFTTTIEPHTEYLRAKGIAMDAKSTANYTLALALHLFYPGANVDDFGEGFSEYGSCASSWERFLTDLKSKQTDFTEPTLEEIAEASRHVRTIIFN
jgi:hypothetical protein